MADQQVLEPHQQAMRDVEDLARALYEGHDSGAWDRMPWPERGYWIDLASNAINRGWRRPGI